MRVGFKRITHTYIPSWMPYSLLIKCYHGSLALLSPSWPSGPHRPMPHPPPVRPKLIWHTTPTLHTCVCVVQIGWRQWWHSHSCGWLVFPRLQHSHPTRGQIWGRCWEGFAARYSSRVTVKVTGYFSLTSEEGWVKRYCFYMSLSCITNRDATHNTAIPPPPRNLKTFSLL